MLICPLQIAAVDALLLILQHAIFHYTTCQYLVINPIISLSFFWRLLLIVHAILFLADNLLALVESQSKALSAVGALFTLLLRFYLDVVWCILSILILRLNERNHVCILDWIQRVILAIFVSIHTRCIVIRGNVFR